MQQQGGVDLVGTRQGVAIDRFERRFVSLETRERCGARRRIDAVEFAVGTVVADECRTDRRKPGEIGDVFVRESFERGVRGARSLSAGEEQ